MTKTIDIKDKISLREVVDLALTGNEVIVERNGEPIGKFTPIEKPKEIKQRVFGLGKGTTWMSEDFNDELPDEFWGFDKGL